MLNFSWRIQRKTPYQIGQKNKNKINLQMKIEKSLFRPSLKKDLITQNQSQPVFYIGYHFVKNFKWIQIIEQNLLNRNLTVYGCHRKFLCIKTSTICPF